MTEIKIQRDVHGTGTIIQPRMQEELLLLINPQVSLKMMPKNGLIEMTHTISIHGLHVNEDQTTPHSVKQMTARQHLTKVTGMFKMVKLLVKMVLVITGIMEMHLLPMVLVIRTETLSPFLSLITILLCSLKPLDKLSSPIVLLLMKQNVSLIQQPIAYASQDFQSLQPI